MKERIAACTFDCVVARPSHRGCGRFTDTKDHNAPRMNWGPFHAVPNAIIIGSTSTSRQNHKPRKQFVSHACPMCRLPRHLIRQLAPLQQEGFKNIFTLTKLRCPMLRTIRPPSFHPDLTSSAIYTPHKSSRSSYWLPNYA